MATAKHPLDLLTVNIFEPAALPGFMVLHLFHSLAEEKSSSGLSFHVNSPVSGLYDNLDSSTSTDGNSRLRILLAWVVD